MYFYCYVYVFLLYVYIFFRANRHSSATLTEGFPCFFLGCKANARVTPVKTVHGPHSSKFLCCFMYCLFCVVYVLFVCKCALYYCHRVATQLRLTNISYRIIIEDEKDRTCSTHVRNKNKSFRVSFGRHSYD